MFTGIIRHVGCVREVRPSAAGRRFGIDLGPLAPQVALGDSVAVNGACLTAAALAGGVGQFDVIYETLERSTLGKLSAGSKVNLELALRAGQGLDGHIVQGHVDGIARLRSLKREGGQYVMEFTAGSELTDLMVPKGSVAVSGVSLTLVDAEADYFSVALIPTTLQETTLGLLKTGDEANIETDIIGRYVRKYLGRLAGGDGGGAKGSLTMDKLRDAGFL